MLRRVKGINKFKKFQEYFVTVLIGNNYHIVEVNKTDYDKTLID